MRTFVSLFRNMAFRTVLMIGLFLTSVLIILAMLLGNESGNFVIQVEDGDVEKSIGVTENIEDGVYPRRLIVEGMKNISDNTPLYFLGSTYEAQQQRLKEHTLEPGRKIDGDNLYIYTFYIVNTGSKALNLDIEMTMSNITKGMDNAIRILTYNETDEIVHIYQKKDEEPAEYSYYLLNEVTTFTSGTKAFNESAVLRSGTPEDKGYIKYSVLYWLEGQDPECTNEGAKSIASGTIKFNLNIKVVG